MIYTFKKSKDAKDKVTIILDSNIKDNKSTTKVPEETKDEN